MQEPERIKRSQVRSWINHPITRVFIKLLKDTEDGLVDSTARGGCIPPPDSSITLAEAYFLAQGSLNTLSDLLGALDEKGNQIDDPLVEFMFNSDLVEKDEESDDE